MVGGGQKETNWLEMQFPLNFPGARPPRRGGSTPPAPMDPAAAPGPTALLDRRRHVLDAVPKHRSTGGARPGGGVAEFKGKS